MSITFITDNCEIELKFDVHEGFKTIKRVDKFKSGLEVETVEKYNSLWSDESVRFCFVSKTNAIIYNGGRIKECIMKKQTKIKVTAIAAGFTFATFIGTVALVSNDHPAQWYAGVACIIGMCVSTFIGVTIED